MRDPTPASACETVGTQCVPRQSRSSHPPAPPRMVVVLGGLPGAGKTTAISRMPTGSVSGVVVLDPEQVTTALRRAGVTVRYPALRPLVHGWHLIRVIKQLAGDARCVLTTDPLTGRARRLLLAGIGRATGRTVHVFLLDVAAPEALRGQHRRGRTLRAGRMSRHVRRWARLRATAESTGRLWWMDSVTLTSRADAPARIWTIIAKASTPALCASTPRR